MATGEKKPKKTYRYTFITVYCSPGDVELFKKAAKLDHRKLSQWAISRLRRAVRQELSNG